MAKIDVFNKKKRQIETWVIKPDKCHKAPLGAFYICQIKHADMLRFRPSL